MSLAYCMVSRDYVVRYVESIQRLGEDIMVIWRPLYSLADAAICKISSGYHVLVSILLGEAILHYSCLL
jgi:hypothetical protein